MQYWAVLATRILLFSVGLLSFATCSAFASLSGSSEICDAAAEKAANETGVPLQILRAITRTETGRSLGAERTLSPWPWAVNLGGKGYWFNTADEVLDFVSLQVANGVENMDVGCFQLNHRWHAEGFESLEAMINPQQNALYAAHYLRHQFELTGDWSLAAGAYHSRNPENAGRYREKFDGIFESLVGNENTTTDFPLRYFSAVRQNNFPLLLANGQTNGASLVPLGSGGQPMFGAP